MKVSNYFSLLILLIATTMHGDNLLLVYLKPYPFNEVNDTMHEQAQKISRPWKLATAGMHVLPQVSGIGATYAGFLTFSDNTGQISFPLKHSKTKVTLVITPRISPALMAHLNVHHWEVEENTPAAIYEMEMKQDPTTQVDYWETKKIELPENRILPLESLVLFSHPKHFFVPEGITPIKKWGKNLVLPDIYVHRGIKTFTSTLYLLNIKGFFGPKKATDQKADTSFSTIIEAPYTKI